MAGAKALLISALNRAGSRARVGIRAGRQEIIFSRRFVHSREAVNIRVRYDGVRTWAQHGARVWRDLAPDPYKSVRIGGPCP